MYSSAAVNNAIWTRHSRSSGRRKNATGVEDRGAM